MDDRIGKKKPLDLVRSLLLARRSYWAGGLFLLSFLIYSEGVFGQNTTDSTVNKYPCDTTLAGKMKCAEWYSDGNLHIVKKYKDGVRHGVWMYYYRNGELDKKVKYRRGEVINQLIYKDDELWKTIDRRGKVRYRKACDCLK